MAIGAGAGRHGVQSGQGKAGRRVIELAIRPLRRVVALLARGRESRVRHRRPRVVVVGLMATDAGVYRDVVDVVGVAVGALARRHGVRAGQRES